MSNVKVVLNSKGVRELLKGSEMQSLLHKYGSNALSRLGDGYDVSDRNYPERFGITINARTYKAKKENSQNNTILKAIGGK